MRERQRILTGLKKARTKSDLIIYKQEESQIKIDGKQLRKSDTFSTLALLHYATNLMEIRLRNITQATNKISGRNVRTSCKTLCKVGQCHTAAGTFCPKVPHMICIHTLLGPRANSVDFTFFLQITK